MVALVVTDGDARQATTIEWHPEPLSQVASAEGLATGEQGEVGVQAWRAVGDDPQFMVELGSPMAPGWYRVRGRLAAPRGVRLDPMLYPDYGDGASESGRIELAHVYGSASLDCVFRLRRAASRVRFDPLSSEGMFELGGLRADAISEREALWLMLRSSLASLRENHPDEAAQIALHAGDVRRSEGVAAALEWIERRAIGQRGREEVYRDWISTEAEALSQLGAGAVAGDSDIRFSIVLFGDAVTSESDVRECVQSLRRQSHRAWELLIADIDAASSAVDEMEGDPRLRLLSGGQVHASALISRAVREAAGTHVFPLHARSRLAPWALAAFAANLEAGNAAAVPLRVLYCDQDFLDRSGGRHSPWFKTDWDPELALAQDYLSGATVIDTSLACEAIDGRPLAVGGAAYDLALRCAMRCEAAAVGHLPHVALHTVADGMGPDGLPARAEAAHGAVAATVARSCLDDLGIVADVQPGPWGRRVRSTAEAGVPSVEIVVPTRDRVDLLSVCVGSVLDRTRGGNYRIAIVDNGSIEAETKEYFASLAGDDRIRILPYDEPFNYSAINNYAVRQSRADIIVLLNNDVEVISEGWLQEMSALAMRPGTGAVGAKLYYPDDTIQHAGVILGVRGVAAHPYLRRPRDYRGYWNRAMLRQSMSAVTAACLAVRRSVFEEVGGLDEALAVAFNDVDFCLRVGDSGYRNVWTPYAELYHHESATRGYEDNPEKQARFANEVALMRSRWGALLDDDPAYNPNLDLRGAAFDIDPMRAAAPCAVRGRCGTACDRQGAIRVVGAASHE